MNGLAWLKTYQAAASSRSGTGELLTYGELDSTSTHLRYPGETSGAESIPIEIATLRLDDEVQAGRLKSPQFIKIDVEGHGGPAVEGMRNSIEKSRPILVVAFHSKEEVESILGILKPLGYEWSAITQSPSDPGSLTGGDFLFVP